LGKLTGILLGLFFVVAAVPDLPPMRYLEAFAYPARPGNNAQWNEACSIAGLIYVAGAGCYTNLPSAIAAATSNGTAAGTIIVPAGLYVVGSTPLVLGSETAPVTLRLLDGASISCAGTAGNDCIDVPSHSLLIGANWGHGISPTGSSGVYCGANANITSLVTNYSHGGPNDALGGVQNIYLSCLASGVTISRGVLWWQNVSNNWGSENVSIESSIPAPAFLWTAVAPGYLGPNYIQNLEINCLVSGCTPFEISGNVGPMEIDGGDINYHPSSTGSGSVVLFTPGSLSNGPINITFSGTHFEAQTDGDFFNLNGVSGIQFNNVLLDSIGGATATNCLHVRNTAGTPGPIRFSGHIISGTCTSVVNNASGNNGAGVSVPSSSLYQGDVDYTWGGQSGGSHIIMVDAQIDCLNSSGCFSVPTTVVKKGNGSGNYTTTSTSFEQVDSSNLIYTVTIPAGWNVIISASGTIGNSRADRASQIGLGVDGNIVQYANFQATAEPASGSFALNWVVSGDGNSHTVDLRFATSAPENTTTIYNTGSYIIPVMVFQLVQSN
jgi:hypothetical protein